MHIPTCENYDPRRIDYPVIVQPKVDGIRCLVVVSHDGVKMLTRNAIVIAQFSETAQAPRGLRHIAGRMLCAFNGVYDGELFVGSFEATISAFRSGNWPDSTVLYLFDVERSTVAHPDMHLNLRLRFVPILSTAYGRVTTLRGTLCVNESEVDAEFNRALADGYEGIVIKRCDGTRADTWMRRKTSQDVDMRVVALNEGAGRNAGMLGSMVCELNGARTNVPAAAMPPEQRRAVWESRSEYLGCTVQVRCMGITARGRLRQPVFERFRPDKD